MSDYKPLIILLAIEDDQVFEKFATFFEFSDDKIIRVCNLTEAFWASLNKFDRVDLFFVSTTLPPMPEGVQVSEFLDALKARKSKPYTVVVNNIDKKDTNIDFIASSIEYDDYLETSYAQYGYLPLTEIMTNFKNRGPRNEFNKIFSHNDFFLTKHPPLIKELKRLRDEVLTSNIPILLQGPTGTGKTSLAKFIHFALHGNTDKFVALNCSNFQEELFESELFGHKKGAFSGAINDKKGMLELADGGTLFLDEVGSLTRSSQQKLLKAIEEGTFYPVGSEIPKISKFRLISATCDDLLGLVAAGKFRRDLFFRITGANLNIPALNERPEDIELLRWQFSKKAKLEFVKFKPQAKKIFDSYNWPGNVRELKRFYELKKGLKKPFIDFEDLPPEIRSFKSSSVKSKMSLSKAELEYIRENGFENFVKELRFSVFSHFYKGNLREVTRATGMSAPTVQNLKKVYDQKVRHVAPTSELSH